MLKACGVGMAMLSGHQLDAQLVDRFVVNVGTARGRPSRQAASLVPVGRSVADCRPLGGAEAP